MKLTQRFTLDFRQKNLVDLHVVNGDTANEFVITLKNKGAAVSLNPANLYKVIAVFTRADGRIYTQDADTGVSFTTAGVVTISVNPSSFRTGSNTIKLQVYARESADQTTYEDLLTTGEARFKAVAEAIPGGDAPNSPSQLPMLEQLIADAVAATAEARAATAEAQAAANAQATFLVETNEIEWNAGQFRSTAKHPDEVIAAAKLKRKALVVRIEHPENGEYVLYEYQRETYVDPDDESDWFIYVYIRDPEGRYDGRINMESHSDVVSIEGAPLI